MKTIDRRIGKLEHEFGTAAGKPQLLLVVSRAGWGLALDQDRCIQILGECGSLPTGPVGVVNLGQIPDGLNAEELEKFLRENGSPKAPSKARTAQPGTQIGRAARRLLETTTNGED